MMVGYLEKADRIYIPESDRTLISRYARTIELLRELADILVDHEPIEEQDQ